MCRALRPSFGIYLVAFVPILKSVAIGHDSRNIEHAAGLGGRPRGKVLRRGPMAQRRSLALASKVRANCQRASMKIRAAADQTATTATFLQQSLKKVDLPAVAGREIEKLRR